jgi:hypothetical protein
MSIRIARFFGVDPAFVDEGFMAKLSPSAIGLFIYLMRRCDRMSSRQFVAKDREITASTGVSAGALCGARKALCASGLIEHRKDEGGYYTYVICDAMTGKPYPGDPKDAVKYEKRSSVRPPTGSSPSSPPDHAAQLRNNKDHKDPPEAFAFGCNIPTTISPKDETGGSVDAVPVTSYSPFHKKNRFDF